MTKPTVAVLGASADRKKFGNKSVRAHLHKGYDVYPVNPNVDEVEGLKTFASLAHVPVELDRVTVYLPAPVGLKMLEEIKRKGAREIWFNPGSESPELLKKAGELGLDVITACSIVDLGVSPSQFPG